MNRIFTFLFLLATSITLSQQKEMNGFGKLQLGMTKQEVKQTFNLNNTDVEKYSHTYMRVTDNLVLNDVRLTFKNDHLVAIRCDYSEKLHNGLSQVYGQENRYSTSGGILFKYKTNTPIITCVTLYNKETIIYNTQLENSLLFKKLNPALLELNKVEGFEGL